MLANPPSASNGSSSSGTSGTRRRLGARVSQRFARAVVTSTLEGRTSFTESLRLLGFRKMATFNQLADHLGIGA